MRALILLIGSPFVMMLAVAGVQTIEFHMENETPVPVQAYCLIVLLVVWGALIAICGRKDMDKAQRRLERFMDNLNK